MWPRFKGIRNNQKTLYYVYQRKKRFRRINTSSIYLYLPIFKRVNELTNLKLNQNKKKLF